MFWWQAWGLRTFIYFIYFFVLCGNNPPIMHLAWGLRPVNHVSHHHPTEYKILLCSNLHICLSELCKYSEKSGEILSDCKEFYIRYDFKVLEHSSWISPVIINKKFLKSAYYFFFLSSSLFLLFSGPWRSTILPSMQYSLCILSVVGKHIHC